MRDRYLNLSLWWIRSCYLVFLSVVLSMNLPSEILCPCINRCQLKVEAYVFSYSLHWITATSVGHDVFSKANDRSDDIPHCSFARLSHPDQQNIQTTQNKSIIPLGISVDEKTCLYLIYPSLHTCTLCLSSTLIKCWHSCEYRQRHQHTSSGMTKTTRTTMVKKEPQMETKLAESLDLQEERWREKKSHGLSLRLDVRTPSERLDKVPRHISSWTTPTNI